MTTATTTTTEDYDPGRFRPRLHPDGVRWAVVDTRPQQWRTVAVYPRADWEEAEKCAMRMNEAAATNKGGQG